MEELQQHASQAAARFHDAVDSLAKQIKQPLMQHWKGPDPTVRQFLAKPYLRAGVKSTAELNLLQSSPLRTGSSPRQCPTLNRTREPRATAEEKLQRPPGEKEKGGSNRATEKKEGLSPTLALVQPLPPVEYVNAEGPRGHLMAELGSAVRQASALAQRVLLSHAPSATPATHTGRPSEIDDSRATHNNYEVTGQELVLFRPENAPLLRLPRLNSLHEIPQIQWHELRQSDADSGEGPAVRRRRFASDGTEPAARLRGLRRLRRSGTLSSRVPRRPPAGATPLGRARRRWEGGGGTPSTVLQSLPEGLQKTIRQLLSSKQIPLLLSARYESRTGVCEGCMAADAGPWLRLKTLFEGRPGRAPSRLSLFHDFGLVRLRWDTPRAMPSLIANLHSGEHTLLQYFFDRQERRGRRNGLVLGMESDSGRYRGFVKFKVPSVRCDLISVDFPNGDLWYHKLKGWKANVFVPIREGIFQVETRLPGSTKISYSFKTWCGTKIVPSLLFPEGSATLDISQPLCWQSTGPSLRPLVIVRFAPTVRGRSQGWTAEVKHVPCDGVVLQCGFRSCVEPVAFGTCALGRCKRAENENELGPGIQLNVKVPPSNPRRVTFAVEVNKCIDF